MNEPSNQQMPTWMALREHDPHPAVLVVAAVLLMAGAAALLLFARSRDREGRLIGNPAAFFKPSEAPSASPESQPPAGSAITDLGTLRGANASALQGREVALRDMTVQSVSGDFVFWIGPDATAAVPVVLLGEITARQREAQVRVRSGARVHVFGVVRLLPDSGVLNADRLLDPAEKERLSASPLYISATRVIQESGAR